MNTNYFVKLFKGDVSLPITYWVFGVLIGNIGILGLNFLFERYYLEITKLPLGNYIVIFYYLFILAVVVFLFIAIWRSAGKYDGPTVWKVLARLAIVIGTLRMLIAAYEGWSVGQDIHKSLGEEIKMINKSLPTMLDSATRLDSVSMNENSVDYSYTLVLAKIEGIKIDVFESNTKSSMLEEQCRNEEILATLKAGVSFNHLFHDKNGNPITTVTIKEENCL